MNEEMDIAAAEAGKALEKLPKGTVETVSKWWRDNYMKAGHKRLARVLLGKSQPVVEDFEISL